MVDEMQFDRQFDEFEFDEQRPLEVEPKPGQLWRWSFTVNDGWWMLQAVSDRARREWDVDVEMIKRGEVFVITQVDDEGPAQLPNFDSETGLITTPQFRWHIALLRDRLVWIKHDDLRVCALVQS